MTPADGPGEEPRETDETDSGSVNGASNDDIEALVDDADAEDEIIHGDPDGPVTSPLNTDLRATSGAPASGTGESHRRGRSPRATYGFVRAFFLSRPEQYREFQRTLNRGHIGMSYDRYLTRLVYLAATVAVVGLLAGATGGWLLARVGLFTDATLPAAPSVLPDGPVGVFNDNRNAIGIGLVALATAGLLGAGTWYAGRVYPSHVMSQRRQRIELVLPDATVFMYALSESGMNLGEIINRLASSEDAYGEVAAEFEVVRRDMRLYGNDLYTSVRNLRNNTPSRSLASFLDDMLSLQEAGGDMTSFFSEQSDRQLQRAREQYEDLLQFLALLSEVFVVGFVAAPLFIIVIMSVISLLGDDMLFELGLFIYLAMPVAFVGFGLLISVLLDPYVQTKLTLDVERRVRLADIEGSSAGELEDNEEYEQFQRFYRRKHVRDRIANPVEALKTDPLWSLAISVPVAVVYLAVLAWQGIVPLTVAGWQAEPVLATNLGVVAPLLMTMTPVAVFHEFDARRQQDVVDRFPNTLNVLASSNSMGLSLVDGLAIVANDAGGYYARQLRLLQNDIRWNNHPSNALLRFANRLDVPLVSRTLKLLAEGRRTTTDLAGVLRIAATDTRNRFRLLRRQKQEMVSYVIVVIVGYLVFLGVIVILDQSYLQTVTEVAESTDATDTQATSLSDVPVDTYRLLFFHAVVIQAVGAGLLSGLLIDNRLTTGFKFTVGLLAVAAVVFTVL